MLVYESIDSSLLCSSEMPDMAEIRVPQRLVRKSFGRLEQSSTYNNVMFVCIYTVTNIYVHKCINAF